MSNKNKQTTEKIVTVADMATMNNRDDDSLSFISGGQLLTEENKNYHKTRIITTSDGKVWVQPANGGSEIDLTQTALSTEQIQSIDSLPEMKDRLHKELELINEHGNSIVKENDIQNQRLDILEYDIKRVDVVEEKIMNIPTTSIRTTSVNQGLSAAGTGTLATNSEISTVLTNISNNVRSIRGQFPRVVTRVSSITRTGNNTGWMIYSNTNNTRGGNNPRLIGIFFEFTSNSMVGGRQGTLFIPRNARNNTIYQVHLWPSNTTSRDQRQILIHLEFQWTSTQFRIRFRQPVAEITHNASGHSTNQFYNQAITIRQTSLWTDTLGNA